MFTLRTLLNSLEDYELTVVVLVQLQNSCLIVHPIAIIGRRPERHQLFVKPINVPLLHQLMCPDYEIYLIQQIKLVHNLMPKNPSRPSRIPPPRFNVLGVRPHQVRQRSFVRYLLFAVQQPHLVDRGQVGRESSMHAQNIAVDDGSEREEVKSLVEVLPAVRITIFFVNLVQKTIHHRDVATLMVAPQKVDAVRMLNLEAEEEGDGLDRVIASVYEISNHYEFVVRHTSTLGKEVFDIIVLSMDITGQVYWRLYANNVGLLREDGLDHVAQRTHGGLSYRLARQGGFVPLLYTHISIITATVYMNFYTR